jgi:hypothetical protein
MDEQIVQQSDGLEKIICELERLNALVYDCEGTQHRSRQCLPI